MIVHLLGYHSSALCASKGKNSTGVICHLWKFNIFLVYCYTGKLA